MEKLKSIRNKYIDLRYISEGIYLTLKDAIMNNVLKAGEKIVEDTIASVFDVSRTPVREVIKRLEIEGFLQHDIKYGYTVKVFTVEEIIEIIETLEYLRQIAVRIAAPMISEIHLNRLRKNISLSKELFENNGDVAVPLNEFHLIIAQSLNNKTFLQAYERIDQQHTILLNRYPPTEIMASSIDQHEEIVDALEAHDVERSWQAELLHSRQALVNRTKRFIVQ